MNAKDLVPVSVDGHSTVDEPAVIADDLPPIPAELAACLLDFYADWYPTRPGPREEPDRAVDSAVARADATWHAGLRAANAMGYGASPDDIAAYLLERLADDPPPAPHTEERHGWIQRHTVALQRTFHSARHRRKSSGTVIDRRAYRIAFIDDTHDTDGPHIGVRDAATGRWRIRGIGRWTYGDNEVQVLGPAPATGDEERAACPEAAGNWTYTVCNGNAGECDQHPIINGQRIDGAAVLIYLHERGDGHLAMFVHTSDNVELSIVEAGAESSLSPISLGYRRTGENGNPNGAAPIRFAAGSKS